MEQINMSPMYKAIMENNWPDVQSFINQHSSVMSQEFGTRIRETPLHVAAKFGHLEIVNQLMEQVGSEYLAIRDHNGYTPLMLVATHSGVIQIATNLIQKNPDTLTIPVGDMYWAIPVTMALHFGLSEMGRHLYNKTSVEAFRQEGGKMGFHFVKTCLSAGELGILLDLLQKWPELFFIREGEGISTIGLIATCLPNSVQKLSFWKRCFSHYIQQEGANSTSHQGLLCRPILRMYDLLGIKEIREIKIQHARADNILDLICENILSIDQEKKRIVGDALVAAATSEKENDEFVV